MKSPRGNYAILIFLFLSAIQNISGGEAMEITSLHSRTKERFQFNMSCQEPEERISLSQSVGKMFPLELNLLRYRLLIPTRLHKTGFTGW